jgi:hypothetical protein
MTQTENAILKDTQRGAAVEADGNAPTQSVQLDAGISLALDSQNDPQASAAGGLGPNNERLEQAAPRLVNALRELVVQFRQEGIVARRHEIRRIRQARLFWQGLQYSWWNPQDMNWHLPWEAKIYDDSALEEMPRYQFVTNLYQAFGLSFVSVISQDVPATRFYPQSTLNEADIETAKAASQVADLIEQNNRVQQLLTGVGFYLWTDGKIGGYVRYVADGQRFGWRDELMLEERWVRLGRDAYMCPNCGAEIEAGDDDGVDRSKSSPVILSGAKNLSEQPLRQRESLASGVLRTPPEGQENGPQNDNAMQASPGAPWATGSFLTGTICPQCGATLGANDFRPAPLVPVPQTVGTRRVANGQEVISIVGGLELNTPVWANEQHEFPYLQWQMEVHRAKLKAAFPHAADKIQMGGPQGADDIYARATRIAVSQGMPTIHPGDALFNLITFSRTWMRPWAFYSIEDAAVRDQLLRLFPDGCYVAFAGETYCESRNESLDDCWRVMHALPGDGQNRPSVGDSLIELQERYNTLSNIQAETYDYGIPPIYADPQVLDFDALANQTAEPAAHYPARARPGMSLADGFFQPAPAQVPPDMLRHQQDLIGPIAQFLTGLFPAVFGGEMENVKTASGYAMARDQALGRLGLVWRRLKTFYCDVMLLAVDCFRKSRPGDVEIPFLGAGGEFQARFIRLANLKGNIQAHPESDETFPRLKSQQRAVLQQLMTSPDPALQAALREPANLGFIKSLVGLSELVVPGDDARNKQLREIQTLLTAGPTFLGAESAVIGHGLSALDNARTAGQPAPSLDPQNGMMTSLTGGPPDIQAPALVAPIALEVRSTVPVDELLDDHATEFEECRRWASSDAGQIARVQNPAGFANVRAHAAEHAAALARQQAQAQAQAALLAGAGRSKSQPQS